jgi:hypothetical protein
MSSFPEDFVFKNKGVRVEDILNKMVTNENIEMKTEINRPMELTALFTLSQTLIDNKMPKSGKAIQIFIDKYLLYMTSYQRKRSKEVIEAITALLLLKSKENSTVDRLMGKDGK